MQANLPTFNRDRLAVEVDTVGQYDAVVAELYGHALNDDLRLRLDFDFQSVGRTEVNDLTILLD